MKTINSLLVVFLLGIFLNPVFSQTVYVQKTNPKPVYMHIMPWFDAPGTLGAGNWGYHWKMQKMDPNIIVDQATGRRQIASHYYPLIGPYDSSDPDVIDYQLLLMKLSGVDGILVDWYGTQGTVNDISTLLKNSNAIINRTGTTGLKFGLVIEDRFTGGDVTIQKNSMSYIKDNYFTKSNYFRYGTSADPVVGIFGPIAIKGQSSWNTILGAAGEDVEFLPLQYQKDDAGTNSDGEYAWPYQTPNTTDYYSHVESFLRDRAPGLKTAMGVVYPGFHDFYALGENGGQSYFYIPHNGTQTLSQLFGAINQYNNNVDILQLATWNDYGEGTMFEPTVEFGYSFLVKLQQYTGVSYTEDDLKQVTRFYNLRKQYVGNVSVQSKLDQVYNYFAALKISDAVALMCTIDQASGCIVKPTVSISSSGNPSESGVTGAFKISGINLSGNITVNYVISGIASLSDYTANPSLTGSIVLSPAQDSQTITITPVDDVIQENSESLIITLSTSADYLIGQSSAQLSILDNEPLPCVAPIISYTASAPIIDQSIESIWAKAPVSVINKVSYGSMSSDFSGSKWRAMYDNNYLYMLVEVNDISKYNDSGTSWWEDDVVEIFIDGDNSKGIIYDGVNDFQIAFRYNDTQVHAGSGSINTSGINFSLQNVSSGYIIEARIPWTSIGIVPALGKTIGLEVSVDDDDNGGVRDAQMSTFSTEGNAYGNPSVFGTVYLTTCTEVLPAPIITSSLTATAIAGMNFSYSIIASNNPTSYSATGLPVGLNINANSGVISGTPTVIGSSNVSIKATNATGTDTKTLTITVKIPAPVITSSLSAEGTVGSNFSYSIIASNNPTSYSVTGLPSGLSINTNSGLISGTPTIAGSSNIIIKATNATGTDTKTLIITIKVPVPIITSSLSADGIVGSSFNYSITASNSPTSYSATGLPSGLSINTNSGLISGTPTVAGSSNLTIKATNSTGTDTKILVITIKVPVPVITSSLSVDGIVDSNFNYSIIASNNPTSYSATGLPSGLSINANSGLISGTPTVVGSSNVTIKAINSTGTDTKILVITIKVPVPVITSSLSVDGVVGKNFSYLITASNNPESFQITGLPEGLSLNTNTGEISGIPITAGIWEVKASVSNETGTITATLVLNISSVLGVNEIDSGTELLIYPNPVREILNICLEINGEATVCVLNLEGKLLYQKSVLITQSTIALALPSLPKGAYIVEVQYVSKQKFIRSFQID